MLSVNFPRAQTEKFSVLCRSCITNTNCGFLQSGPCIGMMKILPRAPIMQIIQAIMILRPGVTIQPTLVPARQISYCELTRVEG